MKLQNLFTKILLKLSPEQRLVLEQIRKEKIGQETGK